MTSKVIEANMSKLGYFLGNYKYFFFEDAFMQLGVMDPVDLDRKYAGSNIQIGNQ